jgi:hypothetical protein
MEELKGSWGKVLVHFPLEDILGGGTVGTKRKKRQWEPSMCIQAQVRCLCIVSSTGHPRFSQQKHLPLVQHNVNIMIIRQSHGPTMNWQPLSWGVWQKLRNANSNSNCQLLEQAQDLQEMPSPCVEMQWGFLNMQLYNFDLLVLHSTKCLSQNRVWCWFGERCKWMARSWQWSQQNRIADSRHALCITVSLWLAHPSYTINLCGKTALQSRSMNTLFSFHIYFGCFQIWVPWSKCDRRKACIRTRWWDLW